MKDDKSQPAKEGVIPDDTPETGGQSTEAPQKAPEAPKASGGSDTPITDVSSLVGDLTASAPTVNQDAIAQHQAEETAKDEQKAAHSDKRDKDGNPFDPDLHVTDEQGNPKTNADGTLKKKRGRKKGSTVKSSVGASSVGVATRSEQQSADIEAEQKARFTGQMMASFFTGTAIGIFGDEWVPKKTDTFDEMARLEGATIEYVKATGLDIPPSLALMMAWSSYAVPRFAQPQTKAKIAGMVTAIKGKKNGAQSDRRNDGKREDNASQKDGR